MNDALILTLSGAAGVVLGAIFFGGLWWTVRRGVTSPRPVAWFFGSLVLRMSVVIAGFYFVGVGDWRRMAACLVGFILARIAVTRLTSAPVENIEEARDAS
ncbi:MAG: F1F0 ATPase subunit 2 [Verrucomicrobiales bacterium]|jgi:F1F0 ATPase subunit 2